MEYLVGTGGGSQFPPLRPPEADFLPGQTGYTVGTATVKKRMHPSSFRPSADPSEYRGDVRASRKRDTVFLSAMTALSFVYLALVLLLLVGDFCYTSLEDLRSALSTREIRYAAVLSLASSTITAVLSVWVATPIGYLMSRGARLYGETTPSRIWRWTYSLIDALLDVPIVLPPLVVGVSLLILFRFPPFAWVSDYVVYEIPAIVLAQFVVACAFAVRIMRATFEQIPDRQEKVAMTLGASRAAAFWTVLIPQARPGLLSAATISWARALGEFGPILIFASSTRLRTEVLPTTVYLEMQAGNLRAALAVSLMMIAMALMVLVVARLLGQGRLRE